MIPPNLAANPRLNTWIGLDSPGEVVVRVGKVELGQGILTALAQIAADELDVGLGRIVMRAPNTAVSPDEGATTGSVSIQSSGAALRQVCAEVRALLLAAASAKSGIAPGDLGVTDGVIRDTAGTFSVSYWELAVSLDRNADGLATPKVHGSVVGTSPPRLDLPDKLTGRPRYIHDLELPGQLFGRVVRPPSRAAVLTGLSDVDIPATLVRDGTFLGVVAEREELAVRAAEQLARAARWDERDCLSDVDDLPDWLRAQRTEPVEVIADQPTPGVVDEVRARYSRPFLAHGSIAPSCGVALWQGDELTVWTHSQSIYRLRQSIAHVLGLQEERIVVRHVEGAGAYGHNGADDVAFDAVLLARTVPGRPVQVVWSRADELGWAPLGAAMAVDITAGVDAQGNLASWRQDVWSPGHTTRPGYAGSHGLLAATHIEGGEPFASAIEPAPPIGGLTRNAVPYYDIPSRTITGHLLVEMPLRTSALRSLGAHLNVFAIESTMDELAHRADLDPVEYRLTHLSDDRASAVITRAAEAADWSDWQPRDSHGHGIAFGRYKNTGAYCAVVAEIEATHRLIVHRLVIAADVGLIISPDGVRNQLEGGAVQSTSWTLFEQVRFDRRTVTSTDWETYPILRFPDAPTVHIELINRPDHPSLGAGEATQGPASAAIANALRDALGIAIRDLPLTPSTIAATLESS